MNHVIIYIKRRRWYVRLWRWLTRHHTDGTKANPHHKIKRALKDIPLMVPADTRYEIRSGTDDAAPTVRSI